MSKIRQSDIDAAIKGKYKTILKLGLLDPLGMSPYSKIGAAGEREPWNTEKDRAVAREVARESVVLLKNATGLQLPYAISWSQANVPEILHITHAAQEQGTAIADALFGDYNPGGRLVQTWPKSLDRLPPIEDYDLRHGRTYLYFRGEPLYPFGYGLSYTTFGYSSLKLSSPNLSKNGAVDISVQVKNTGKRAGDEVVQLYKPSQVCGRAPIERAERVPAGQAGRGRG